MSDPNVTVVVRRIHSLLNQESEILESVKDKFEELLSQHSSLTQYLDHVDEKGLLTETTNSFEIFEKFRYKLTSESTGSHSFLRRFLVKIAHDSEDVIDDIIKEATYKHSGRYGFLKKYVCNPCFQIDPRQIQKIEGISKKLREEKKKLEQKKILHKATKDEESYVSKQKEKPTDQRLRPHKLVGLEKVINCLVQKIIESPERVLYIVGTGGSGKTTLAAELNNHPDIKNHFKSVLWASVSEKKEAKDIFLEILRKSQGKDEDSKSSTVTQKLLNKICNILEERPYLIILDDVQDPDNLSTHLFPMIQGLNSRSKLVITTRVTPSNPYKHGEYTVTPYENADSLAEKLTETANESSIFYVPANQVNLLLFGDLYSDSRVKEHFNARKWVNVEDDWDSRRILLDILQKVDTISSTTKVMTDTRDEQESQTVIEEDLEKFLGKPPNLIVLQQEQKADSLVYRLHPILNKTKHRNKVIIITNNLPTEPRQNEDFITGEDLLDAFHLLRKLSGEGEQPILFSIRDLDGSGSNKGLATKLYNHSTVRKHFDDSRIWITIPRGCDAAAVLRQIIKETTGNDPSIEESNTKRLADLLLSALEEKKCLLVLDDMDDAADLVYDLLAAHSTKADKNENLLQSKIIITTGNPRTVQHSNLRCALYEMQPLPKMESWDLLCEIAFNQAKSRPSIDQCNTQPNGEMNQIVKMLEHCKGIPLAIVALGGLLSTKETVKEWEMVSDSLGSEETWPGQALERILLLSYHDLHNDIMPCFLYFSLFPQHSEISTGMLIRMWLSEGLVALKSPSGSHLTLENVAAQYLEELACRCLIQVVRRNHVGRMKTIHLHDKIHQISITKSTELGFLKIYPPKQDKPLLHAPTVSRHDLQIRKLQLQDLRRTAIHPGKFDTYPTQSSKLRTLVQFGKHGLSTKHYYFQHDTLFTNLEPIHKHLKLLRVLILSGIRIRALPEQIGELIFLTYLGLRATRVLELPKTIGNLQQLITLDYVGTLKPSVCKQLPNVLCDMKRLRHVYLPAYAILSMKKLDLSTLQNLQILWGVSGGDWLTDDFPKTSISLLKLGIVNISCAKELDSVMNWLIDPKNPRKLQVLKLDWHTAKQDKLHFPKNLNHLPHLHKLALIGRLEEEYNFSLLSSLVKLELYFSHLEKYDPTEKLGNLPLLKILHLWNSYKGIQWSCGSNMFLKLEELQISHLPNLEKWRIEAGAMPHLRRLSIYSCRKLSELPKGLRYIKLQELEILDMPKSFSSRLHEIKEENKVEEKDDVIQNIPHIKFEAC